MSQQLDLLVSSTTPTEVVVPKKKRKKNTGLLSLGSKNKILRRSR